MIDMAKSGKPVFLGGEFDAFLFAPVGADAAGTSITLVSLLARLDLDPWDEAACLTRLPGAIATQKLAALISKFPEIPGLRLDSSTIAARLTALLPGRILHRHATPQSLASGLPPIAQALMAPRFMVSLLFIVMTILFTTQLVMGDFHTANTSSAAQTAAAAVRFTKTPLPGDADAGQTGR
jgi:hypothetical protein